MTRMPVPSTWERPGGPGGRGAACGIRTPPGMGSRKVSRQGVGLGGRLALGSAESISRAHPAQVGASILAFPRPRKYFVGAPDAGGGSGSSPPLASLFGSPGPPQRHLAAPAFPRPLILQLSFLDFCKKRDQTRKAAKSWRTTPMTSMTCKYSTIVEYGPFVNLAGGDLSRKESPPGGSGGSLPSASSTRGCSAATSAAGTWEAQMCRMRHPHSPRYGVKEGLPCPTGSGMARLPRSRRACGALRRPARRAGGNPFRTHVSWAGASSPAAREAQMSTWHSAARPSSSPPAPPNP
jgi:hypothetical protein